MQALQIFVIGSLPEMVTQAVYGQPEAIIPSGCDHTRVFGS